MNEEVIAAPEHDAPKTSAPVCVICGEADCPYVGGDIINFFR